MASSLEDYYKTTHTLRHSHGYDISELNAMMPWELAIEVAMLTDSIQKEINAKGGL
jgi:hypothetical protein